MKYKCLCCENDFIVNEIKEQVVSCSCGESYLMNEEGIIEPIMVSFTGGYDSEEKEIYWRCQCGDMKRWNNESQVLQCKFCKRKYFWHKESNLLAEIMENKTPLEYRKMLLKMRGKERKGNSF